MAFDFFQRHATDENPSQDLKDPNNEQNIPPMPKLGAFEQNQATPQVQAQESFISPFMAGQFQDRSKPIDELLKSPLKNPQDTQKTLKKEDKPAQKPQKITIEGGDDSYLSEPDQVPDEKIEYSSNTVISGVGSRNFLERTTSKANLQDLTQKPFDLVEHIAPQEVQETATPKINTVSIETWPEESEPFTKKERVLENGAQALVQNPFNQDLTQVNEPVEEPQSLQNLSSSLDKIQGAIDNQENLESFGEVPKEEEALDDLFLNNLAKNNPQESTPEEKSESAQDENLESQQETSLKEAVEDKALEKTTEESAHVQNPHNTQESASLTAMPLEEVQKALEVQKQGQIPQEVPTQEEALVDNFIKVADDLSHGDKLQDPQELHDVTSIDLKDAHEAIDKEELLEAQVQMADLVGQAAKSLEENRQNSQIAEHESSSSSAKKQFADAKIFSQVADTSATIDQNTSFIQSPFIDPTSGVPLKDAKEPTEKELEMTELIATSLDEIAKEPSSQKTYDSALPLEEIDKALKEEEQNLKREQIEYANAAIFANVADTFKQEQKSADKKALKDHFLNVAEPSNGATHDEALQNEALAKAKALAQNYTREPQKEDLKVPEALLKQDLKKHEEQISGFEINYQSQSPNYDELAKVRQDKHQDLSFANFNEKETLSTKLSIVLCLRQLIASFFASSTLSVIAPATANRFGPSAPSFTPIPLFFIGLIAGSLTAFICSLSSYELAGGLCLVLLICMLGCTSFRGIGKLIGLFSKRRSDAVIEATGIIVPAIILTLIINANFILNKPFEVAIALGLAAMIASASAVSLCLDVPQDPVDSYGTLTIKGFILSLILAIVPAFLVFELTIAASVLGIALFFRVIIGQYLINHGQHASRLYISATRHIIMQAIMLDLIFLGNYGNITNDCFFTLCTELLAKF